MQSMVVLFSIELVLLLAGLVMVFRPGAVNSFARRVACALRLRKREAQHRAIPTWRKVVTVVVGLPLVGFVVNDWSYLRMSVIEAKVPTVTAGTLSPEHVKQIDDIVIPVIRSGRGIGIVVGVTDHGRTWIRGYGCTSVGNGEPPDADSVFEIGSVTKTFTCSVLSVMGKRGEVRLDDPVDRYLPPAVRVPRYGARQITLDDLATHRSSLPVIPDNMGKFQFLNRNPYAVYTTERIYQFLNGYKLPTSPGTVFGYSNLGMGLLGIALCRKANLGYEDLVTSEICRPLGMMDTSVALSSSQKARLVQGFVQEMPVGKVLIAAQAVNWTLPDCIAGAGALRSTARDMLKYVEANIDPPDSDLGQALRAVHVARSKIDDSESMGLGWQIRSFQWADEPVVCHAGGTGGYRAFAGFCEKRKLGVVVLCNSNPGVSELGEAVLKAMVGAQQ